METLPSGICIGFQFNAKAWLVAGGWLLVRNGKLMLIVLLEVWQ